MKFILGRFIIVLFILSQIFSGVSAIQGTSEIPLNNVSAYIQDDLNIGNIEYIIIAPEVFSANFQLLVEHKNQYLNATVVNLEDILENRSFWVYGVYGDATNSEQGNPFIRPGEEVVRNFSLFNDTSAKIRNFIRFAHFKWNTKYVLLGGDNEFIPARRLFAFVDNWAAGHNEKAITAQIPTDHYFSALNGTWNPDYDSYFGETAAESIYDEADFSSEIYIGRAPVNDKSEVNIFVHKVLHYETSVKPYDVQIHQSYTNLAHKPDTTEVSEACANLIPDDYIIHRLYERDGLISQEDWINAFSNPNKFLMFHVGNGYNDGIKSWYQLCWKDRQRVKFDVMNAGALKNSFYPIHVSISCLTADFSENECLAEEMLLTAYGGPSACIGNTEVGSISREDARLYSGEFYEQLFKELFKDDEVSLGKAVHTTKETFSDSAGSNRHYRWCFYIMTLLGDPETPVRAVRSKVDFNFDTFYVDDDFSIDTPGWNVNKFKSIQSAINSIQQFGTIRVQEGVYLEEILLNKTITIEGVSKESTIILNNKSKQSAIIHVKSNSSHIKNFSIQPFSNDDALESLIYIYPKCNRNTIVNCNINNNTGNGIFIEDSIRNLIVNNSFEYNDCGLYFYNVIENEVIITCDNHIESNVFRKNRDCGVYIRGSIHNFITNNIFISNGENSDMPGVLNQHDLCLMITRDNVIDGNYWNEPLSQPYKIYSIRGPIFIFIPDFSRGYHFNLWECIRIYNRGIMFWPVFDYNPSNEILCQDI